MNADDTLKRIETATEQFRNAPFCSADWLANEVVMILGGVTANDTAPHPRSLRMTANPPTPARQTLCADASCPLAEDHVQGSPGCSFASPTPAPVEGLVERARIAAFEADAEDRYRGFEPERVAEQRERRRQMYLAGDFDCGFGVQSALKALAALKPTGDRGELVEVEKLVRELHEDADAWMAGDVERDNEVAGLLSYNAARQIEECAARITADAALIEAKDAEIERLRAERNDTPNPVEGIAADERQIFGPRFKTLTEFTEAMFAATDQREIDTLTGEAVTYLHYLKAGWDEARSIANDLHTVAASYKARAEAAEAKLAEARAALEPFAKAVEAIDKHDPDFPENGAALRASFDFWSTENTRRCVTYGDLRHAAKQFATLANIDGADTLRGEGQ